MDNKYKFLLIIGCVMANLYSHAQTMEEKYVLNFQDDSWIREKRCMLYTIDSSIVVNGKHPGMISSDYTQMISSDKSKISTEFSLAKEIILPDGTNKTIRIELNSKSRISGSIYMKVTGYNEHEKLVVKDSTVVNSNDWNIHTLTLDGTDVRLLTISIFCKTNYSEEMQKFRIDRIGISIDDRDFNKMVASEVEPVLSKNFVYPLNEGRENTFAGIEALNNRKIIGLGESMSGSEEIKRSVFQAMKSLIVSHGYNVIMLEMPMDICLKWDLYTQGLIPETTIGEIDEELRMYFAFTKPYVDFFNWLRQYNADKNEKIRIFGFDHIHLPVFFHDYLRILKENSTSPGYFSFMMKNINNPEAMLDSISSVVARQRFTSDADYQYVKYIVGKMYARSLSNMEEYFSSWDKEEEAEKNIDAILSLYLRDNSKAIVYAHSSHINKLKTIGRDGIIDSPLGNFLYEKYGEQYFTISFQAGMGTNAQKKSFEMISNQLPYPENHSFERACLNIRDRYFYYPAQSLPTDIYLSQWIFNYPSGESQYKFFSLADRFHAYVFIRQSNSLIYSMDRHISDFLYKRKRAMSLQNLREQRLSDIEKEKNDDD
jgi:erythromycin esterase-like protein